MDVDDDAWTIGIHDSQKKVTAGGRGQCLGKVAPPVVAGRASGMR